MHPIKIIAEWDNDKVAWIATGEILEELVIEANTIEELIESLKTLMPQLLRHDQTNEAGDNQMFLLTKIWPVNSCISWI